MLGYIWVRSATGRASNTKENVVPRINTLTIETAPDASKPLLEGVNQKLGKVPNLFATLAHSPAALQTYFNLKDAIAKGSLGDKIGESVAIAIATKASCDYCANAHYTIGGMVGVEEDERSLNLQGKSNDPKTQAAIDLSLAIIEKRGFVDDSDLSSFKKAGFTDADVLEILSIVTLNTFTNYANHIAQTVSDFPKIPESATA